MSTCNGCDTIRKINELIDKYDKLEDENHDLSSRLTGSMRDSFSSVGTVYGFCAEELRILIREI